MPFKLPISVYFFSYGGDHLHFRSPLNLCIVTIRIFLNFPQSFGELLAMMLCLMTDGYCLFRWSNSDEPGDWLFRIGNTGPTGNVEPPQISSSDNGMLSFTLFELLLNYNKHCIRPFNFKTPLVAQDKVSNTSSQTYMYKYIFGTYNK